MGLYNGLCSTVKLYHFIIIMEWSKYTKVLLVAIVVVVFLTIYEMCCIYTIRLGEGFNDELPTLNQPSLNPSNNPLFGIYPINGQIIDNIEYSKQELGQGIFSTSDPMLSDYPQIQSTIYDLSSNAPYSTIGTNASNTFVFNDGIDTSYNQITRYDPNNYSITYHSLDISSSFYDVSVNIPYATYYIPDTLKYDPKGWVPNYEESVYLSKLTGLLNVADVSSAYQKL